jgi:hypothetical protein
MKGGPRPNKAREEQLFDAIGHVRARSQAFLEEMEALRREIVSHDDPRAAGLVASMTATDQLPPTTGTLRHMHMEARAAMDLLRGGVPGK